MPRLLDLYCGAGGAAMGYHRAGWEVVGVDIRPQPRFPFEFVQADALSYPLEGFDAVHASPPCQAYSLATRSAKGGAPRLIGLTRARLELSGVPWVLENVRGAAGSMHASLRLCGSMFGLAVVRHRLFESSHLMWSPPHDCRRVMEARARIPMPDWMAAGERPGVRFRDQAYSVTGKSRRAGCIPFWRELMEMPWALTGHELSEAIPPAYTEWIGRQLLPLEASSAGIRERPGVGSRA